MNINKIVKRVIALTIAAMVVGYALGFLSARELTKLEIAEADEIAQVEDLIEDIEIKMEFEEPEAIEEEPAEEVEEETVELTSLGTFKITNYCACQICCGVWSQNRPTDEKGNEIVYTASGERAIGDYTVAVDPSVIPLGTVLIIDGKEYKAMDTGAFRGNVIDIYRSCHEDALNGGCLEREVFTVGN